jgi:hypothetical protein
VNLAARPTPAAPDFTRQSPGARSLSALAQFVLSAPTMLLGMFVIGVVCFALMFAFIEVCDRL